MDVSWAWKAMPQEACVDDQAAGSCITYDQLLTMYRCEFRQECIKRVGELISNEVQNAIDTQYRDIYQVNVRVTSAPVRF